MKREGLDDCATILCGVILAKLLYTLRRVRLHLGHFLGAVPFIQVSQQSDLDSVEIQWSVYRRETRIPDEGDLIQANPVG